MDVLKKIFKQTSYQFLGKVITSLSTFIILGIVARNYGEKGTGIFTLALTYLALFYLIADFGFNAHVLKKIQVDFSDVKKGWHKLFGTRLVWSAILVVIATLLLPLLPFAGPEFNKAVMLGAVAIIGSGIFVTCNLIFQSKLRYDLSVLASGFGTAISLLIFIYLSSIKVEVPFLLLAHGLGWIVISVTALILVKRYFNSIFPLFDLSYTKSLVKESWPIAATLALNVVYFRIDSFLIAYFKGVSDAGIYNVAYSVFQSALVFPSFIMNAYYPLMLRSFKGIKMVGIGLLVLAFLGLGFAYLLAPQIIELLTGSGFVGSIQSLQILSLGFPAFFISALLMWVMVTRGLYKRMLLIYTIGLVINFVLNFIYIPQYSYLGASWVTVISEYLILGLLAVSLLK